MSIGQKIIDEIIQHNLVSAECAEDQKHPVIFIWSSGAAEQLDAVVRDFMEGGDVKEIKEEG